jgi:hypothetical protein
MFKVLVNQIKEKIEESYNNIAKMDFQDEHVWAEHQAYEEGNINAYEQVLKWIENTVAEE